MAIVVPAKIRVPRTVGLRLERLDAVLDTLWDHRIGLVVAPAGSGKTTLLAGFAQRVGVGVGWYRAESWDRDEETLVSHLESALSGAIPGIATGWVGVDDAARALEVGLRDRALLVIDDLHTLEGTAAEAALERFIDHAPASLAILAGSRIPPRFNLSRLRVSGDLLEIGGDDLRFRSWEVERLFRDFYEEALPPEELARLARHTEGWAAGLQLFHLATRGRPADERRRLLAGLGPGSRLMREYLARNVLEQLPADLREFLVGTSVLGRLSGPLCDSLLGRTGSRALLEELERRRLFTTALSEEGHYRYHEVLRSHVQGVLTETLGEARTRERFAASGELLTSVGAVPEAIEAFARAEDWDSVEQLLAEHHAAVGHGSLGWLDALPPALMRHDPRLIVATARRLRADGRFNEAMDAYARAEAIPGANAVGQAARRERAALVAWHEPTMPLVTHDWSALLRTAVMRDPLGVARAAGSDPDVARRVVAGLAMLLGGKPGKARRLLLDIAEAADAEGLPATVASLAAGIAAVIGGEPHGEVEIIGAVGAAEGLGFDWLARIGLGCLALGGRPDRTREADALAETSGLAGDRWGAAILHLAGAWGRIVANLGTPEAPDGLVAEFGALGAPVLEAWARGLEAVAAARLSQPDTAETVAAAEATARAAGVPGATILSTAAMAWSDLPDRESQAQIAGSMALESGIDLPWLRAGGWATESRDVERSQDVAQAVNSTATAPDWLLATNGHALSNGHALPNGHRAASGHAAENGGLAANGHSAKTFPPLRIHLLGPFSLELAGEPLDEGGLRPRVRTLLRLLAVSAGTPVHRETIQEALWPSTDPLIGARNLHVAVSALRRVLEPGAARGSFRLVRRVADSYLLWLPPGSEVDLIRFETSLAHGRAARGADDDTAASRSWAAALETYTGELLPEEGPSEWVTQPREACRAGAIEAAHALADLRLRHGDVAGAASACSQGLGIDRYHDPFWRILIAARERAGDQGAAIVARQGYRDVLAELGLDGAVAAAFS